MNIPAIPYAENQVAGPAPARHPLWRALLPAAMIGWMALTYGGLPRDTRLIPYLLLLLSLYLALRGGNGLGVTVPERPLIRWAWAPAAGAVLASFWSVNFSRSYDSALLWVAFAVTLSLCMAEGRESMSRAAALLMAALALPILFSVMGAFFGHPIPIQLTFDYRNATGIMVGVLLILCVSWQLQLWVIRPGRRLSAWWPTAAGLVASIFLWYTSSRGGLYMTLLGLAALVLLVPRRWRLTALALSAGLVLAGLLGRYGIHTAAGTGSVVAGQGNGVRDWSIPPDTSITGRLALWKVAWRAFLAHPWGWGPGAFGDIYFQFWRPGIFIYSNTPHSLLFESLEESGPFMLVGLVGLAFTWARSWLKGWNAVPELERPLLGGACAALLALAGHSFIDLTWDIPAVLLTAAALLGLTAGRLTASASAGPETAPDLPARPTSRLLPLGFFLIALVLLIRPYYAATLVDNGQKLLDQGELTQAAGQFRLAARIDPLNADGRAWLAESEYRQWQKNQSASLLQQAQLDVATALRVAPRSTELLRQAAELKLKAGDKTGFLAAIQEGLRYSSLDPSLQLELAKFDLQEGRATQARQRLEAVENNKGLLVHMFTPTTLQQNWPDIQLTLAMAYKSEQRPDMAIAQLQQLLKELPQSDIVHRIVAAGALAQLTGAGN